MPTIKQITAELEKYKTLYAQAILATLSETQKEMLVIMACEGDKSIRELKFRTKSLSFQIDALVIDGIVTLKDVGDILAENTYTLTEKGKLIASAAKAASQWKLLYRHVEFEVYGDYDLACCMDMDWALLETVGVCRHFGKTYLVTTERTLVDAQELWLGNVPRGLAFQQGFKNAPFTMAGLWFKPLLQAEPA